MMARCLNQDDETKINKKGHLEKEKLEVNHKTPNKGIKPDTNYVQKI